MVVLHWHNRHGQTWLVVLLLVLGAVLGAGVWLPARLIEGMERREMVLLSSSKSVVDPSIATVVLASDDISHEWTEPVALEANDAVVEGGDEDSPDRSNRSCLGMRGKELGVGKRTEGWNFRC